MIILNPLNTVCFIDTIQSLQNEFKDDKTNAIIIVDIYNVSKNFDVKYFKLKYPNYKIIAFNQEPLLAKQRQFMHKLFYKFLVDADEVWDYDEKNIEFIKNINSNVKLHILKPYKDWSVYKPVEKDIDILFYGAINEHRAKVLNELEKRYKVVILQNIWGDDLDNLIIRSKILLNVHFHSYRHKIMLFGHYHLFYLYLHQVQ